MERKHFSFCLPGMATAAVAAAGLLRGFQFRDEMMKPWPSRALYRVSVPKSGVAGVSVHGTFHHVETALGVSGAPGASVLDLVESLIRLCTCMHVSSPRKGVVRAVWREKWMIELKREPGAESVTLYRLDEASSVWKAVWSVGRVTSASADADGLFAVVVADVAYVDLLVWHFFTVLVAVFRSDCCASREECAGHACSKVRCIGAVKMMPDGHTPVLDARGRPERHVIEKECRPSACCRIPYRVGDGGATVWNPDHYDYVAWIPQYAVSIFDMHGGHAVFRDFFSMCLRALRAGEPLDFYNGLGDARREEPARAAVGGGAGTGAGAGNGAGAGPRSRLSGGPAGTKPVPVFMS